MYIFFPRTATLSLFYPWHLCTSVPLACLHTENTISYGCILFLNKWNFYRKTTFPVKWPLESNNAQKSCIFLETHQRMPAEPIFMLEFIWGFLFHNTGLRSRLTGMSFVKRLIDVLKNTQQLLLVYGMVTLSVTNTFHSQIAKQLILIVLLICFWLQSDTIAF